MTTDWGHSIKCNNSGKLDWLLSRPCWLCLGFECFFCRFFKVFSRFYSIKCNNSGKLDWLLSRPCWLCLGFECFFCRFFKVFSRFYSIKCNNSGKLDWLLSRPCWPSVSGFCSLRRVLTGPGYQIITINTHSSAVPLPPPTLSQNVQMDYLSPFGGKFRLRMCVFSARLAHRPRPLLQNETQTVN